MKSSVTKMILIPYERYRALLGEMDNKSDSEEDRIQNKEEEGEEEGEGEETEHEECMLQSGGGGFQSSVDDSEFAQKPGQDINPPPPGLPANTSSPSLDKEQTQDSNNWKERWVSFKS